mmetsp:Transcript_12446/g.28462  ORF Transcript_12446/g.28462 Transcript_12446/m.28462 type:complete len:564 (+) Transcript_12446:92-1783(+)
MSSHTRNRRRGRGQTDPLGQSASLHLGPDPYYHGHPAPPNRLFSQQSALLLIVGMGMGYIATISFGTNTTNTDLNTLVENLERKKYERLDSSASPLNILQSSRENTATAMMLRKSDHRRIEDSPDEAGTALEREVSDGLAEETARSKDELQPMMSETGAEAVDNAEAEIEARARSKDKSQPMMSKSTGAEAVDFAEAETRFIETQKLLATQSIPTATNPIVMKTASLPDSKRKKILVTGGAGFVGSHLVDTLMMEGHEVIALDNFFTGQRKNVDHWMNHPRFSLVVHDVTEPIMLEVDEIYHLACPASPPHYQYNPVKTIKTSTMGTINMLGLAKRVKAKILLTSTSEIYGDPEVHPQPESYWGNVNTIGPRSCYDEGKRVAETMMYSYKSQNNVDVRVARIFNTFGPRMHPNDGRVVSNFIIQSLQNKPMTIYGDGSQTRSFQFVSDLVNGLHSLMNGKYDLPVNLGNPDEYTVKHFAEYIKEITQSDSEISFLPATKDDPTQRKPDISTAKRELKWEPKVTVKEGLQQTIAYFSQVLKESGEIIPTGQEASRPKPKVADES